MKMLWPLLILFSMQTVAAPFLTADPQCYDSIGARSECPNRYEVSDDDGATWSQLGSDNDGAQIWVWQDMAGYANGGHLLLIRAANVWGVSAAVPFDFTAGIPVGPGGLRLVAP